MVYADRSKYVGADTPDATVQALMSKEYAKYLASLIKDDEAQDLGSHDPFQFEHVDTTHFTVADKEGNVVAVTFTINYYFGAKIAPAGYGFMLNDEMDDFSANPFSPNCIAPGKYPLSSMSPTIVLNEDGSPFVAVGSPGGTTIIVAVAQVILNTVLFGMDMQEAIEAPRFSEKGSGLQYEARIPQDTIDKLVAMGHKLSSSAWGEWDMSAGSTQGVLYAADGTLHGGADPRRDNKAFAF